MPASAVLFLLALVERQPLPNLEHYLQRFLQIDELICSMIASVLIGHWQLVVAKQTQLNSIRYAFSG